MAKRPAKTSTRGTRRSSPRTTASDMLRIGVTLPPATGITAPTKRADRLHVDMIDELRPATSAMDRALGELQRLGFDATARGSMTVSVRGSKALFERVFGTELAQFRATTSAGTYSSTSFYFPAPEAPWSPDESLHVAIDDAYIQWPHIYMNSLFPAPPPSPLPPRVPYHHLRVPGDVVSLVNAGPAHRNGITGKGVTVAMIDSGFASGHPYFKRMGYNMNVVLAPGATDPELDGNGHGTGESANLLAIAPDVNFIGVKLDNEANPNLGASMLEGIQEALSHQPDIISLSLGYDLVPTNPQTGERLSAQHLTKLPNSLVALETEIAAAVASGTTIVFSAGNGHVSFPGMMPDVISAGGVFVAENGAMEASSYASAFKSRIYPGRSVPDLAGLVGLADNHADYIMLPIPPGCEIDNGNSAHDGTGANDGWGVFSGTSAAAPQLAGVCALLKQSNPGLTPAEIKSLLTRSAVDVTRGRANAASNVGNAMRAGVGSDGATGSGLVDAAAALRQA